MNLTIHEKDREKVLAEIAECQSRVIQTLVPTIIAVGLISIADKKNLAMITVVAAFAVLFCSSLYVASLNYKIFRNASFVRALAEIAPVSGTIHWETALSLFYRKVTPPHIIGYEVRTVSVVYLVFAAAYVYMFYKLNLLLTIILGLVLAAVAVRIFLIPFRAQTYCQQWKDVLNEHVKTAGVAE